MGYNLAMWKVHGGYNLVIWKVRGVQRGYMEGLWGTLWVYGRSVGDIVGIWRVCGVYCGVNEVHEVYKGPYQVYTGQGQDATRSL